MTRNDICVIAEIGGSYLSQGKPILATDDRRIVICGGGFARVRGIPASRNLPQAFEVDVLVPTRPNVYARLHQD